MKYFLNIMTGILLTLFGLYLWFNTDATIQFFSIYFGMFFVLFAILGYFFTKYLGIAPPYGQLILSSVVGIVFLFLPMLSYAVITWIFIFMFSLFALLNIIHVFKNEQTGILKHVLQIIIAVIFIVYAIVMLCNPTFGGQTLTKITAFFVMMNGVSYFFPANYLLNTKE
ncbi:MAG: DUF308 domain-containing protein [Culicoidibacterales bacterium]